MPYVQIPKDLTKIKAKVAFNLTARQIVCFGGGALLGIPAYFLTRGAFGNEGAALVMIGLALPLFLFGIYEKDGQPLEKRLGHFIRARFFWPSTRPYRTENLYAALERLKHHEKEVMTIAEKEAAKRAAKLDKKLDKRVSARQKAAKRR